MVTKEIYVSRETTKKIIQKSSRHLVLIYIAGKLLDKNIILLRTNIK